jgi:hypothetical protein
MSAHARSASVILGFMHGTGLLGGRTSGVPGAAKKDDEAAAFVTALCCDSCGVVWPLLPVPLGGGSSWAIPHDFTLALGCNGRSKGMLVGFVSNNRGSKSLRREWALFFARERPPKRFGQSARGLREDSAFARKSSLNESRVILLAACGRSARTAGSNPKDKQQASNVRTRAVSVGYSRIHAWDWPARRPNLGGARCGKKG